MRWLVLVAAWGLPLVSWAQFPTGSPAVLNAAMTQLFGPHKGFTARAEVRLWDRAQKDSMRLPLKFALRAGNIRVELNLSALKGGLFSPEALANLKQLGMDEMVTIVRPDRQKTYVVYPALQAYAALALTGTENGTGTPAGKSRLIRRALGQETIDHHPCTKYAVTLSTPSGDNHQALVWYASDLKGFPIQIQMTEQKSIIQVRYRDVVFQQPAASFFEAPAGFAQHDSVEQLMQAAVMKMFGGR